MKARYLTFAILALALPTFANAQTQVVDEGSFRLSVGGTPVGTETFSIQRSGSGAGATVIAQGRVVLDSGEQVRAAIQLDGPDLRPSAYQIEVSGNEVESYRGQAAGTRFRATIRSSEGEMMREYLAGQGAVIIDDGVAHQHYFLATHEAGSAAIIIPRQSRQVSATITPRGNETIRIGDRSVSARRIDIQPTGMPARTIWVDDQNRVLRLSIPEERFEAVRTALPN